MLETPDERRRRLYGPSRNLRVQEIRERLSKSCVLKDGEYNLTANKLSDGIFDSSYSRDFLVSSCFIWLIQKPFHDIKIMKNERACTIKI